MISIHGVRISEDDHESVALQSSEGSIRLEEAIVKRIVMIEIRRCGILSDWKLGSE